MSLTRRPLLVILVVAITLSAAALSANAQGRRGRGGQGGPGGPGGFGGFGGFGGTPLDLTQRPDVRKELELLDDQVAALQKLAETQRTSMRDLFGQLQDVPQDQRGAKMRELMEQSNAKTQVEIDKILLPHQSERLKQLALQFRLRGPGTAGLLSEEVTKELGIGDDELAKLQAKSDELEEQARAKITQIRKETQDQLIASMTPQQQAKFKAMVGAPFEFQQDQARGGRFGGAGGQRGQRGRRGGN